MLSMVLMSPRLRFVAQSDVQCKGEVEATGSTKNSPSLIVANSFSCWISCTHRVCLTPGEDP